MNFSIKSLGHSLDHLGHFHFTSKFSWQTLSHQQRDHLKKYLNHTLVAACTALGVYLLLTQFNAGISALAALAGVSAFLYFGLLFESTSITKTLLNLLAIPTIFTFAYVSLSGPETYLVAAFLLHALVASVQMSGQEQGRKTQLYSWSSFNVCLVFLL